MKTGKLVVLTAVVSLCFVGSAWATTVDFSDSGKYVLAEPLTYTNPNTFELSSVFNYGGSHGSVLRLDLSDNAGDGKDWVDASARVLGPCGTVNQMSIDGITFETYIDSATGNIQQTQAPYSYIGVDLNGNGVWDGSSGGDALIIPWDATGTPVYQQWFTNGYNGGSKVHVWKNGANMTFDNTGTGSNIHIYISDLATRLSPNGQAWGTQNVNAVFVGAGTWDADGFAYTAFVDNVTFTPEPATIGMLVLGAVGLIRRRRCIVK